jgi:hypothetical protein
MFSYVPIKHKQMSFVSNGGKFKLYTVLNGLILPTPTQPRISFERPIFYLNNYRRNSVTDIAKAKSIINFLDHRMQAVKVPFKNLWLKIGEFLEKKNLASEKTGTFSK